MFCWHDPLFLPEVEEMSSLKKPNNGEKECCLNPLNNSVVNPWQAGVAMSCWHAELEKGRDSQGEW